MEALTLVCAALSKSVSLNRLGGSNPSASANAGVAQWIESPPVERVVAGSSPVASAIRSVTRRGRIVWLSALPR